MKDIIKVFVHFTAPVLITILEAVLLRYFKVDHHTASTVLFILFVFNIFLTWYLIFTYFEKVYQRAAKWLKSFLPVIVILMTMNSCVIKAREIVEETDTTYVNIKFEVFKFDAVIEYKDTTGMNKHEYDTIQMFISARDNFDAERTFYKKLHEFGFGDEFMIETRCVKIDVYE